MTTYILYHQIKPGVDCPDGIAAAWVARQAYPISKVVGCCYGEPCPVEPQKGDRLVIVDFSYPANIIKGWADAGISVVVIDHHKTAWEELHKLAGQIDPREHNIAFDMEECGATLAWKVLIRDNQNRHAYWTGRAMPAFLEFIRKRDLWLDCELFADPIPNTLIVHEAIATLRYQYKETRFDSVFDIYNMLSELTHPSLLTLCRAIGLPKLEEKRKTVKAIADRYEWEIIINPLDETETSIPVVKLQKGEERYTSDVCMVLYREMPDAPFVACTTPNGEWSLRSDSKGNNTDVGAIAKALGGGGHRNAAGFRESEENLKYVVYPNPF